MNPRVIRAGLLVYGLVVTIFGVMYLDQHVPNAAVLMETRANSVRLGISVLDRGGPPLLATQDSFDRWPTGGPQDAQPLAVADDQGFFIIVPLLGHLLGVSDPFYLAKLFLILFFAPLLFLYPILFYETVHSATAALLAPLVLLFGTQFTWNSELYYAPAWAALTCLPLLWVAHVNWPRRWAWVALFGAVALGALASTIRYHAGLPALLAALCLVLLRASTWRGRIAFAFALVVAYGAISESTVLVERYRDAQIGRDLTDAFPTHHALWHGAYIGLGYLPNPYGLRFSDTTGAEAAERVRPGVVFGSNEYEDAVRQAFFELVAKDPTFVIQTYLAKAAATLAGPLSVIGAFLLAIPGALLIGSRRWRVRGATLLAAPFLAFNFVAPVLYVPFPQYQLGWLGSWAALAILAFASLSADAVGLARRTHDLRSVGLVATSAWWALQWQRLKVWRHLRRAIVATLVVVGLGAFVAVKEVETSAASYYQQSAAAPFVATVPGDPVYVRSFRNALPPDWSLFKGARVEQGSQTIVHTNDERFSYQLWSMPQSLPGGDYTLLLDGSVDDGGIYLGILEATKSTWIATSYYWYGQDLHGGRMGLRFRLEGPTQVRFVLSNWRPFAGSSKWSLREIALIGQRAASLGNAVRQSTALSVNAGTRPRDTSPCCVRPMI